MRDGTLHGDRGEEHGDGQKVFEEFGGKYVKDRHCKFTLFLNEDTGVYHLSL